MVVGVGSGWFAIRSGQETPSGVRIFGGGAAVSTAEPEADGADSDAIGTDTDAPNPPVSVPAWVPDRAAADAALQTFLPKERPDPTEVDVVARLDRLPDFDVLRGVADDQWAVTKGRRVKVGALGGTPLAGYVWGDLENYLAGRKVFDPEAIVLRLARSVGTGDSRIFYVSAFDAATGALALNYAVDGSAHDLFDHPALPPARGGSADEGRTAASDARRNWDGAGDQ